MNKKILFFFIILALSIISLSFSYSYFKLNPFEKVELENISKIAVDDDENIYVISDSNRSVKKIINSSEISYVIKGGSRKEESFYLARDLEIDDSGNLYLLHNRWNEDGSYLEMETITKFNSKGEFNEIVFQLPDQTESKLFPAVMGLKYDNDLLYWFSVDDKYIYEYSEASQEAILKIPFHDANILVQDIERIDANHIACASKKGIIKLVNTESGKTEVLYNSNLKEENKFSNIWEILSDKDGNVYFDDIGKYEIYKIEKNEVVAVFKDKETNEKYIEVYYHFDIKGDNIFAITDQKITVKSSTNEYKDIKYLLPSTKIMGFRIISIISGLLILLSSFAIIRWLIKDVIKGRMSYNSKNNITIVIIIVVLGLIISNLTIKFYDEILVKEVNNGIKNIVQNSKYIIDGDAVDALNSPSDFYNYDYKTVSDDIQKIINYNQEVWNENLYTALYTIKDQRYYGLLYNDNSITPYYPFNAWTYDDYYYYFYDAYQGEITQGIESDADGEWLFSMGPVYNRNDEIVAIIEVGMNKYIFDEWNKRLINKIATNIVSIIIIAILLISEISFFTNWIKKKDEKEFKKDEEFNDLNIIRSLALITYIMIFMCTAFIPIMAKSIYSPIGNLSMSIAIGLPILAEVFFAAVTILFAGFIAEKKGWRILFYLGMVFLIGAAIATAMTKTLIIFIIARSIAGIGNGMIQMTMHGFVNTGQSVS